MLLFWPLTEEDSSLRKTVRSRQELIHSCSRVKASRTSGLSYAPSCFYSSHKQSESLLHSISECCYTQEKEITATPRVDFSHGPDAHSSGSQAQALSLPPVCFSTQEFIFHTDSSAVLTKSTTSSSAWYKALMESKYSCKTGRRGGSQDSNQGAT